MVRNAVLADVPVMLEIYRPYILDTAITFEYEVPTLAEFEDRFCTITTRFPWLVWEEEGVVLGYAYAGPFKTRAAYQWDADLSIYLGQDCRGKGIGTALYEIVCEYARARRCSSITLNVWCCNEKAMKFYEHLGLVPQKIGMEKML